MIWGNFRNWGYKHQVVLSGANMKSATPVHKLIYSTINAIRDLGDTYPF